MGKRKALLVGVMNCCQGSFNLKTLPSVEYDLKELEATLSQAEYNCIVLLNPSKSELERSIENFFSSCLNDDLALLYFSGHAIRDSRSGILYLTANDTIFDGEKPRLSTALSSAECHTYIDQSKALRKVIIIDSCYSGAFIVGIAANQKGFSINNETSTILENNLGGEGLVVLTSCNSTEESVGSFISNSKVSFYTHYLIEALNQRSTSNAEMTAYQLHEYILEKIKPHNINMSPQIFPTRNGFSIIVVGAKSLNNLLIYRRLYEEYYQRTRGELTFVQKGILESKANDLKISLDERRKIEKDITDGHQLKSENQVKYFQGFDETFENPDQLSNKTAWKDLQDFQYVLKLSDEDINRQTLIRIINLMLARSKYIKAFFIINPDDGRTINIESSNSYSDPTIYFKDKDDIDTEYLGLKFPRLLTGKDNVLKDCLVLFFKCKEDVVCVYSYPDTSLKTIFLCYNSNFSEIENEIAIYRNAMNQYMKKLEYV